MATNKCAVCGVADEEVIRFGDYCSHGGSGRNACVEALQRHNSELTTVINAYATICAAHRIHRRPPEECLDVVNDYWRSVKQEAGRERGRCLQDPMT